MSVIYEYISNGMITGSSSNGDKIDAPTFENKDNGNFLITLPDYLKADFIITNADGSSQTFPAQVIRGGWFFVLDKDNKPTLDGNNNYVVVPPPITISEPSATDYLVLAAIKQGTLDPNKDIGSGYIVKLNQMLHTVGLPPAEGTTFVPLPTTSAISLIGPDILL